MDSYWAEEGRAAYFIFSGSQLAGFAMIHKRPECGLPTDWFMAEFFVAYPYRRQGGHHCRTVRGSGDYFHGTPSQILVFEVSGL